MSLFPSPAPFGTQPPVFSLTQPQTTGVFGTPTTQQPPGGLFGAPAQPQQQQQQQQQPFGVMNPNPLQRTTTTFAGFGAPATTQPAGLFGAPTQAQQPAGLFGGLTATQPNQPTTTGLFGAPANTTAAIQPFGAQTPTIGLFGAPTQTQQQAGLFGATTTQQPLQQQQQQQQQQQPTRIGTNDPKFRNTTEISEGQTLYFHSISAMPEYKSKSFEELRWEDYQIRAGTLAPTSSIAAPFGAPATTQPFGGFGATTIPQQQQQQQPPTTGLFGAPTQQPQQTTTGLFGAPPPTSVVPSSPFGVPPARAPTSFGLGGFGAAATTTPPPLTTNPFGTPGTTATTTTTTQPAFGGFGLGSSTTTQQPTTTGIAGGLFGGLASTGATTTTQPQQQPAFGGFGLGTATQQQPQQATGFSLNFGTATQPTTGFNLGGTTTQGTQQQQQQHQLPATGLFGAPASPIAGITGFGTTNATQAQQPQSTNPFAAPIVTATQQQQTNSPFGGGLFGTTQPPPLSIAPFGGQQQQQLLQQPQQQQQQIVYQTLGSSDPFGPQANFAELRKAAEVMRNGLATPSKPNTSISTGTPIRNTSALQSRSLLPRSAIKAKPRQLFQDPSLLLSSPSMMMMNSSSSNNNNNNNVLNNPQNTTADLFTDIFHPIDNIKKLVIEPNQENEVVELPPPPPPPPSTQSQAQQKSSQIVETTVTIEERKPQSKQTQISAIDEKRPKQQTTTTTTTTATFEPTESVLRMNPNINTDVSAIQPQEQRVPSPVSEVPTTQGRKPKLANPNIKTEPSIQELMRMSDSELAKVHDFKVSVDGIGSVSFKKPVDLRDVDLDAVFEFRQREITVYPESVLKPPAGEKLNQPCQIEILNCMPKRSDEISIRNYVEKIKKATESFGGKFVSYTPMSGMWIFEVPYF